ncbi:F390 synthetase-related protein [Streptococcus dentiloxodontae]
MNKFLFLKTFVRVRWLEKWNNRQKIENHQQILLKNYKKYMEEHSPYFANHGFNEAFQMDKRFMMEHFDELNTVGVPQDKALALARESERTRDFSPTYHGISIGLSSGTSGHYGIFLTSPYEQTIWAATILAKMLPKRHLFGHRIAFFLRSDNNLYQSVNSPVLHLDYYDMEKEITEHIHHLNQQQPTILIAPASVLRQLAQLSQEGLLHVTPKRIISVAEILEDSDRSFIEEAFHQPLHQVYQATEGFLGATCQKGKLHLNEEGLIFEKEWLDSQRFYPVITDLKRRSQPFYRYRLNDILQIDPEGCSCGSACLVIKKIEGRSDDIFHLLGADGVTKWLIYPDFIRRCLLMVSKIGEYQVKQTQSSVLEIALTEHDKTVEDEIRSSFHQLEKEFDLAPLHIQFIPYQLEKRKKLRRIICQLPEK